MDEEHAMLVYDNPGLDETDPEREGVLDGVKTAVCQVGSCPEAGRVAGPWDPVHSGVRWG